MRAVIQRVTGAALSVDGKVYSSIGCGLIVFLGIGKEDNQVTAEKFAKKIAALRIFSDSNDKMNLSVKDIGGEILLVPNFTLCGDSSHGNRPNFSAAAPANAETAKLFDSFASETNRIVKTKTGCFGADMHIEQHNDGPVTIIYEI